MIVYRDIISGDEMITDAFTLLPVVDKEGNTVLEVARRVGNPRVLDVLTQWGGAGEEL